MKPLFFYFKNIANFAFFLILFMGLFSGCGVDDVKLKPRFVIVLIDETDSFRVREKLLWQEALSLTTKIVHSLKPGDAFMLIGIDEVGFQDEDVRIIMTSLDEATLRAAMEKRELKRKIMELKRRKNIIYRASDVLGALCHAVLFLNQWSNKYKGIIVTFSDMRQCPPFGDKPVESEEVVRKKLDKLRMIANTHLRPPEDTEIYCLYANVTGLDDWGIVKKFWVGIFDSAGFKFKGKEGKKGEVNIYTYGDSKKGLREMLQNLQNYY